VALYRKWRPKSFDDVKGQEHIVQTLTNQIKAERIGHAYLFCGTRGTGKTSVAKIFAKAVNCKNPNNGNPCNECSTCRGINDQTLLNVVEIDAASNNGVDNIREIRNEVQYSPTDGKYKVYIIDEVHMLSIGAFNALLKTLEEPPSYVIFILATTEAHKLPITILSRCQRYDFKRITVETISNLLNYLMNKEQIAVQEKAIKYIAKAADGAMRDALSILEQCISFYLGEELTLDKVLEVVGAVDVEVFSGLLEDIRKQDVNACMLKLEDLIIKGKEIGQLILDFTWYLRNLMLTKTAENAENLLDISEENLEVLKAQALRIDNVQLMHYIRVFSELSSQVKYATQKRILLEIALIKLCRPEMETNNEAVLARMSQLEEKMKSGVTVVESSVLRVVEPETTKTDVEKQIELKQRAKALPEDVRKVGQNWSKIISQVSPFIQTYLKKAKPSYDSGNTITITTDDEMIYGRLSTEENINEILEKIYTVIDGQINLLVKHEEKSKQVDSKTDLTDLQKLVNIDITYE
jgi:DNA polymerase-3 subunit gamma/tau